MGVGAGAYFDGWALPPTVPFLNWAWDDILFLILAGILLGAALFVVLGRDIVRSGLSMILCFAALAGIYVLAGAVIVAAAQVLIYIGAISVLILFAIMTGPSPRWAASRARYRSTRRCSASSCLRASPCPASPGSSGSSS